MRSAVLTGLFACVVIATAAANSKNASANSLDAITTKHLEGNALQTEIMSTLGIEPEKTQPEPKKPTVHIVAPNESLITIAAQHQTDWHRLYNKNEHIADPHLLTVGAEVVLPESDEALNERPLPEPPIVDAAEAAESDEVSVAVASKPASAVSKPKATPSRNYATRGSSAGNTYAPGYCTWYAKNMRPDLPNNLGNANTWVSRAAAQGIPTGSSPRVGAIGQQGMHVVYVERVNGDGTVLVSEMNYKGRHVVSSRTVPASNFQYIY